MRGETSSAAERKSGVEGKVEVRGNSAGARIRTLVILLIIAVIPQNRLDLILCQVCLVGVQLVTRSILKISLIVFF